MNEVLGTYDRATLINMLYEIVGEARTKHSLAVERMAVRLCQHYSVDLSKARTAALYHDFAKYYSLEDAHLLLDKYHFHYDALEACDMNLLHAKVARVLAEHSFLIDDPQVLEAIEYHTTAKPNLCLLSKIIFVSDAIEETRSYPGVSEYRSVAFQNIDRALYMILDAQIRYLMLKGSSIHPNSIKARDFLRDRRDDA